MTQDEATSEKSSAAEQSHFATSGMQKNSDTDHDKDFSSSTSSSTEASEAMTSLPSLKLDGTGYFFLMSTQY